MSMSYLNTLPVEILHRIFDNLDIQTIFLSIRYVCKDLYLTTNSYNRYNFNFKSISKPSFQFICGFIPFENVIQLTLSDDDKTRGEIKLFLSLYNIEQFTRLEALTLLYIDDIYFKPFLNYILTSSVKSLSISIPTIHVRRDKNLSNLLRSALTHRTIRNLYLNIGLNDWNDIQWPMNRTLRYLRIVNSITLKHFSLILQYSPNLEALVLKEISTDQNEESISSLPFKQLRLLTFEDGRIEMNKLEQCLSLTPSLIYLKLIGNGTLFNSSFDGYQWEKLIQTKLRLLKNFQFFFSILTYSNYYSRNIEILINSFQTTFWLDKIHCYITCDYIPNSRKIMLYTLPICNTHFVLPIDIKKISLSNFTTRINDSDMHSVQQLTISLTKHIKTLLIEDVNKSSNNLLFRNVTNLTLGNDGEWPKSSLRVLSSILDLSNLVKLSLSVNFLPDCMLNTISNIDVLLNQASNLRSLLLFDYWAPDNCTERLKTICSMVTPNIKHLQIRVKDLDDIKYILERLEHLTSIKFEYAQILTINRQEFIQSLVYLNRYLSMWDSQFALYVWLKNKEE